MNDDPTCKPHEETEPMGFFIFPWRKYRKRLYVKNLVDILPWLLIPFTIFCLIVIKSEYDALQLAIQSIHWPTTSGTITHSSVESQTTNRRQVTTYSADIQYNYKVGGKEYHSSQISLAGWANRSVVQRNHYDLLIHKFPKDKQVIVYYNPCDPSQSVLQPGVVINSIQSLGCIELCIAYWIGAVFWINSRFWPIGNYKNIHFAILFIAVAFSSWVTYIVFTSAVAQMIVPKEAMVEE